MRAYAVILYFIEITELPRYIIIYINEYASLMNPNEKEICLQKSDDDRRAYLLSLVQLAVNLTSFYRRISLQNL